jgi:hypothetical protein
MDKPKGEELYCPAEAEASHAQAQLAQGLLKPRTTSVGRDWIEQDRDQLQELAKNYLQLSADQGNTDAIAQLDSYFAI